MPYRLIAIVFLLSTVAATPSAYALTMEQRAELRRQERLLGTSNSSSSSTSSRSSSRSSALTLYERVQQRLLERLNTLKVEDPEQYAIVIAMLERREERKDQRLETAEPSLKLQVANGVNMERAKRGIPGLKYHPSLETSAQAHADDMITRDYFSHENPEGERSGDRIKKTGYGIVNAQECRCSYRVALGENIAKGQQSVEQVVREWMESDSHREAMLSRDYKDIGVGIAGDVWVLNFGSVEINPVQ